MNQVGRYQILEELGRGASGVVYRALDPAIGRTIAIKSIRFSELADPEEKRQVRERLLREAQSAGILSHPNIVTIYDVLESEDLAYIFMEYVDGESLEAAMRQEELPQREALLQFLRQIAEALDYAHRKGIVHRDIKPANIMLSQARPAADQIAKIADFGVARLASREATHQRTMVGTPSYMAPEQLQGLAVGGAADQFALAVMVYELLCGEKPFTGETLPALFYEICKQSAKPVNELNPNLNGTVNKVMERAMEKLPEERYSSCSEFIGALSVALGECAGWVPVAPVRAVVDGERHRGNGWYAPETIITERPVEDASWEELPNEVPSAPAEDPPADPPPVKTVETALSMPLANVPAIEEYERRRERGRRDDTRIRVERPAAKRLGVIAAACAVVALAGVLMIRSLSKPAASDGEEDSKAATATAPEDLGTNAAKQPNPAPVDLTQPGSDERNPAAAASRAGSTTTVAVRTPAALQDPAGITKPANTATERGMGAGQVEAPPIKKVREKISRAVENPVRAPIVASNSDVELVSDPPGARVAVDGRADLACLAPCSLPLGPGRHTLMADLSGYAVARKIFNVPVGGSVFVSMAKNMGMLLLTSEPSGTSVAVDGKDLGPTPVKISLAAGRHHLTLSDGARRHEETIEIDADGVYARSFRW